MKIKDGFTLRSLCGEHIVIAEGLALVDFNKMLSLNDSAAYLWELVKDKDFEIEDLVTLLTDRYEVSPDRAREDATTMVDIWWENGILE